MNRAEQFHQLMARINQLPTYPLNRREGVLAYFLGSLQVICLADTVQCDDLIRVLTVAVENEEKAIG